MSVGEESGVEVIMGIHGYGVPCRLPLAGESDPQPAFAATRVTTHVL